MNKTLHRLLIVFLSALMLFSLGQIVNIQRSYMNSEKLYEELRAQSVMIEKPPVSQETEEDAFPLININLDDLQAINHEVIGWLWIPETEVNYPILRGADNQRYLTRDYRLKYDAGGSIFMDFRNGASFTDDNTILYGHNMKNGAMFGGLKKYGNPSYREKHPYIYVFTQEGSKKYRIFAAYTTESTSRSYTRTSEDKKDFLAYVASSAQGNLTELPDEGSSLLTLSTCTSGRKSERFVIHGALLELDSRKATQE